MRPVTSSEQQLQLLKSKDKGNTGLGLLHGGWFFPYIKTPAQSVCMGEGGRDCRGEEQRGKLVKGKGKREEAI